MKSYMETISRGISGLTQEVFKQERGSMKETVSTLKKTVKAQNERIERLERMVNRLGAKNRKVSPAAGKKEVVTPKAIAKPKEVVKPKAIDNKEAVEKRVVAIKNHFDSNAVAALRKQHNLSRRQMAGLLKVSDNSIFLWEKDMASPQKRSQAALTALRHLSASQVAERVSAIDNAAKNKDKEPTNKKPTAKKTKKAA